MAQGGLSVYGGVILEVSGTDLLTSEIGVNSWCCHVSRKLHAVPQVHLKWYLRSLSAVCGSFWLLKISVGGDTRALLLTNIPFLSP